MLTKVIINIGEKIRSIPLLSTLYAAMTLSFIWTILWLGVLLYLAFSIDASVDYVSFMATLWVSVPAEALIRWIESAPSTSYFSKPHLNRINSDPLDSSFKKVLLTSFIAFGAICFIQNNTVINNLKLNDMVLGGYSSYQNPHAFYQGWFLFLSSVPVQLGILFGLLFRVVIYKRKHI